MIIPDKYLDLKSCAVNVASVILKELSISEVVKLEQLSSIVSSKLGDDATYNFMPALSLLFVIGKISYDLKSDSILLV